MMISVRKIIKIFFIIQMINIAVSLSEAEEPSIPISLKKLGMGGTSVAIIDDRESFFSNPAILSWVKYPILLSFDTKIGLNVDSIQFWRKLGNYYDEVPRNRLTKEQVNNLNKICPLYEIAGPLNIAYIRRYICLGLFEATNVSFDTLYNTTDVKSSVRMDAYNNNFGMLAFAYDMKLPPQLSQLSAGIAIKYAIRTMVDQQDISDIQDISDVSNNGIIADISRGFELDIGILYKIYDLCSAGLVIRDLLSTPFIWNLRLNNERIDKVSSPNKTKIKPHAILGVSFTPIWEVPNLLTEPVFSFELDGFHPRIGVESRLYRSMWLRTGLSNDGFALGFGYKRGIMRFDYALVSKPQGKHPRGFGGMGHFLGVSLYL